MCCSFLCVFYYFILFLFILFFLFFFLGGGGWAHIDWYMSYLFDKAFDGVTALVFLGHLSILPSHAISTKTLRSGSFIQYLVSVILNARI